MANVITFNCPTCNTSHTVSVEHAGKSVSCKQCHSKMTVPRPQSAPAVAVGANRPKSDTQGRVTSAGAAAPAKSSSQRSAGTGQQPRPASAGATSSARPASAGATPSAKPASAGATPAAKPASSGATPAKKPSSTSARSLIPGGGAAPKPSSNSARSLGVQPTKPASSTPQSLGAPPKSPPPPPPRTTAPEIPAAMDLAPLMDSAPSLMKADVGMAADIDTIEAPTGPVTAPQVSAPRPMTGAATPPKAPPSPPPMPSVSPPQSVPAVLGDGGSADSDVKMNAGDQVLRKSPSGRANDANTQFVRSVQRVSVSAGQSGRVGSASVLGVAPVQPASTIMHKPHAPAGGPPSAVMPAPEAAPPRKSNKGIIIAVGVVVLLAVIVGVAAASGVFGGAKGPATNTNQNTGLHANTGKDGKSNQPSKVEKTDREKILEEFSPNMSGEALYNLFERAQVAKLSNEDLLRIGRPAARKLALDAKDISNQQLFDFAQVIEKLGALEESKDLYKYILEWEPEVNPVTKKANELHLKVRKVLGFVKYDFFTLYEKIKKYMDAVVEGPIFTKLEALYKEAQAKDDQTGWVTADVVPLMGRIAADADKLWAEYDKFLKDNPFIGHCQAAFKRFSNDPAARRGRWFWIDVAPYVLFVELGRTPDGKAETREQAMERLMPLRNALQKCGERFEELWRKPLELKRTWPADKTQEERDSMPIEHLVFAEARTLNLWSTAVKATNWGNIVGIEMEQLRLGYTAPYDFYDKVNGRNFMNEVMFQTYSYTFARYQAPVPADETSDKNIPWCRSAFLRYSLLWLMTPAIKISNIDPHTAEPMGFNNGFLRSMFFGHSNPWTVDASGTITGVGKQLLTIRQVMGCKNDVDALRTVQGEIAKMADDGSTARNPMNEDRARVLALRNYGSIYTYYSTGIMTFLHYYNESEGQEPFIYREGLRKYIGMHMRGELEGVDHAAAFAKCLGLDEAGWAKLEERFTGWIVESHKDWPK
ncbi:MAG: hypothetical protein IT462_02850 [Planctomycetes bacterium]|nr:hypothetical protein [Planctomycetota bacterium]